MSVPFVELTLGVIPRDKRRAEQSTICLQSITQSSSVDEETQSMMTSFPALWLITVQIHPHPTVVRD